MEIPGIKSTLVTGGNMKLRFIPLLLVFFFFAITPTLNLAGQAQQPQSTHFQSRAEREARDNWRKSMTRVHIPRKGCFTASYPSMEWQETGCTVAPLVPHPHPGAKHAHPETVGDGGVYGDDTAEVTGVLSSAEGSFATVSGLTSASTYSLQLNANTFTTSACSGAASPSSCRGWQQFVFSRSASQVFMQYWLLDWGTTCPGGWNTYNNGVINCWKNSSASSVPALSLSDLPSLSVTAETSGGTDTVILSTQSGNISAVGSDSVLDLAAGWNAAEFNVFGDCCSDEATFNTGSTFVVQTSVNNGTTNAPSCPATSTTGETNSLSIVGSCCVYGGASPKIQFMESNDSNATSSCGGTSLTGNFAPIPFDSDSVTVIGFTDPLIEYNLTLSDSAPGASVNYVLFLCGLANGSGSVASGDTVFLESSGSCSYTGTMYATAPGYIASPITFIDF